MNIPRRALVATLCSALLLSACGRGLERRLELPANPPLGSGLGWGLVAESYVRLKAERRQAAADIAHLRERSLVELLGRESGEGPKPGTRGFWYLIRAAEGEGWVREGELLLFSSREQAERVKARGE